MSRGSTDRIVEDLRQWVRAASPGAQLPPTRALVTQYGASPVTIQKALRTLANEGLVETRTGVGAFVLAPPTARTSDYGWQTSALGSPRARGGALSSALRRAPDDAIALHSGYPDPSLLPEKLVRQAFGRVSRSDSTVSRAPAAGIPELQTWFAAELAGLSAPHVNAPSAHDVIVLPGSQSGLSTAFRALVGPGQPLVVESPTYWGAIMAAEHAGVSLVPVASGPDGPDLDALDRALALNNARAFYAQPSFANPTGGQWSRERSLDVLRLVQEHGAFLIEDDWAHDFGIDADPTPLAAHDENGHVVYLRSLTKSVSPAVRIAGVVARGPARDRLLAATQAEFMYVSSALQSVAVDVVTQSAWRTHGRTVRQQLTTRRDALVSALSTHLPAARVEAPRGGLNVWVRLPDGTDLPRLARDCELAGVVVAPGDEWFPAEPTGPFLRLNFAGPDPDAFDAGVERIGKALGAQDL